MKQLIVPMLSHFELCNYENSFDKISSLILWRVSLGDRGVSPVIGWKTFAGWERLAGEELWRSVGFDETFDSPRLVATVTSISPI